MLEYKRKYPLFSLCGLHCGLCPRFHTDGKSKCPGCGGDNFHLKHPTCAVITCNTKHDTVEFCFECSLYPCKRYQEPSKVDSFISYQKVISDFKKTKSIGIQAYLKEINKKIKILEYLITKYNDGRRKNFYCLAVNLINVPDLEKIMETIDKKIKKLDVDTVKKIKLITELFESVAKKKNIELKLRRSN